MTHRLPRFIAFSLIAAIASLMLAMPTKADVVTNVSVPVSVTIFIPCANGGVGDLVTVTGSLHVVMISNVSATGEITVYEHFNAHDVSGTGSTGLQYHGTGVTEAMVTAQGDGSPFVQTIINNFRIIGQGPGNNFLFHETAHITINNNGDVTVDFDNLSVECR